METVRIILLSALVLISSTAVKATIYIDNLDPPRLDDFSFDHLKQGLIFRPIGRSFGQPQPYPIPRWDYTEPRQRGQFVVGSSQHLPSSSTNDDDKQLIPWKDTLGPIVVDAPILSVPEPSTWFMMLLGFAGIGFGYCRRKATMAKLRAE